MYLPLAVTLAMSNSVVPASIVVVDLSDQLAFFVEFVIVPMAYVRAVAPLLLTIFLTNAFAPAAAIFVACIVFVGALAMVFVS